MALGFQSLYDRAERAAGSRSALWLLGAVSFSESAFLPVPVDAVSVPIMLSAKRRIPIVIVIGTVTSVLGGLLGYLLGWGAYQALAVPILTVLGVVGEVQGFADRMQANQAAGAWLIFLGAVTPVPFKVVCIGAGLIKFNLGLFVAAAMAGRVLRFLAFGVLFWVFGEPMKRLIRQNSGWVTAGLLIVLIGGFVAAGYLL